MMISHKELLQKLSYDSSTGVFTWLISPNRAIVAGTQAGSQEGKAYRYVTIGVSNKQYYAHRLAWFYCYGSWPRQIDHKNCDKLDNRIENLREATTSQNGFNSTIKSNNQSGFKGVHFHTKRGKFVAKIKKKGRSKHLGYFDDALEAYAAYCKAAQVIHGQFARVA